MKRIADLTLLCTTVLLTAALLRAPQTSQVTGLPYDLPVVAVAASGEPPHEAMERRRGLGGAERGLRERLAPGGGRSGPVRLTDELIEICLTVAQDIDTSLAARLRKLRDDDPEEFERRLQQSRRLIDLAVLKQKDRNLYDLKRMELTVDAEVSRLARLLKVARKEGRDADAADLEGQLRSQVRLQVAFAIRARQDYICRLEEIVTRLQQEVEHDEAHFDEVVETRIHQLLHDPGSRRDSLDLSRPLGIDSLHTTTAEQAG